MDAETDLVTDWPCGCRWLTARCTNDPAWVTTRRVALCQAHLAPPCVTLLGRRLA